MGFWRYLLRSRIDNGAALMLTLLLGSFYFVMNLPFVQFMEEQAELLQARSPFYGAPFTLNLFNFDPSMYYAEGAPTIIHPLKDLLAVPLALGAAHMGGNLFFLIVQSLINALSAALLFYYLRRSGGGMLLSAVWALFFGVSSYSLFTALIPDSYPYVQVMILFSVVYLLYVRTAAAGEGKVWPQSVLGAANFALTSTNVATFMASVGVNLIDGKRSRRAVLTRVLLIGAVALLIVLLLTLLQWLLFGGETWLTSWRQGLSEGGFSYVAPFSWVHHWQAFYMLFVSPVLTPALAFIDPNLAAFVTDLSHPYPLHVHLVGGGLIVLALLGLVQGRRSREAWIPAIYIGFAVLLHLVIGFGLGTFQYDMYLYAGHSLFALFLLGAGFLIRLHRSRLRQVLLGLVMVCAGVTLVHNIVFHAAALDTVRAAYLQ
ncbi:DUF6080 domain-containing protein [Paenibacillus daejeonensis]|uniref:DUF6080 domain-containing protein n=1 Tax=Paenibacillus daejeonensis TaxID=135193 RepID=UPI00036FB1B7|nr:DUF6080 domain-containing protein [Paenibacillus daejeonensis]